MSLSKQAFVEAETAWLLQRCIDDLSEAARDPASAKYETVLDPPPAKWSSLGATMTAALEVAQTVEFTW